MTIDERRLTDARKPGFGLGLLKGMAVTLKHLFKHNTVIQYPETKQDLPARSRGVIALKEENCTVCMLCARECPDWCIYIDSHKETLAPKRQGGRPRKRNVLDRFAIDYALCMYCGICVEVCPYDALFWSREFEYSEYDIRELTHEKEKLSDWMATVLPPPELEDGAELPGRPAAAPTATQAPARAATPSTKPSQTSSAAEARPEQAAEAPKAPTAAPTASKPETTEERAPVATSATQVEEKIPPEKAETTPEPAAPAQAVSGAPASTDEPPAEKPSSETRTAPSGEEGPAPAAPSRKAAPEPSAVERPTAEELDEIYARTLEEQLAKGSSPPVAEARAKVARVKAERGVPRPPTPVATDHPVPSAPTKGEAPEPTPSGAPQAEEPRPQQGPVAPTPQEGDGDAAAAPAGDGVAEGAAPSAATESGESASEPPAGPQDPEEVYNRVLAEERAKGSSEAVALGRAKAARVRAAKGTRGPGG